MKTFIYTISPRTSLGSASATVYRVLKNIPKGVGRFEIVSAGYGAELPAVRRFLMQQNQVPQGNPHYNADYNLYLV